MDILSRLILVAGFCVFVNSCGINTGSGTAAQGQDLSGVWRFSGVECYSNGMVLTSHYNLGAGNPVTDWTITGNSTQSSVLNSSTCRTDISRNYTFTPDTTTSTYTYGTMRSGVGTASIVTGQGSCSYTFTFTKVSGADINPVSYSASYTNGQSLAAGTAEYFYFSNSSPNELAIPSIIQVVGSPTDVCLLVYVRIS